ncbi:unnamed protein product, partial [Ilex paraguariensis]
MASNQNSNNRHEAHRPKHNTAGQKSAQHTNNKHQADRAQLIKQNKNSDPSQVRKSIHSKPFAEEQQAQAQHSSNKLRADRPKHINQNQKHKIEILLKLGILRD